MTFFCQLNAEMDTIWIAALPEGELQLPDPDNMTAEIGRRLTWMDARTGGKHYKGTNIVPFSIHHIDELLRDLDLTLPRTTRIAQWLRTVRPSNFAPVWKRFRSRLASIT